MSGLLAQTGISHGSAVSLLQEMLAHQEILMTEDAASTGGRRSHQYQLNPDYFHIGCLVLKAGKNNDVLDIFILDMYGRKLTASEKEVPVCQVDHVRKAVRQLCEKDDLVREIMISVPGVSADGKIRACDISGLENQDLAAAVQAETGIVPVVENDVNTAALGVAGSHPQMKHLAVIYQPAVRYPGVGMVLHGKLYNGMSHNAGEVRYLPFVSEAEQDERRRTDPAGLLAEDIEILAAILNPELIGWASDCFDHDLDLPFRLPGADQPRLVRIDINESIRQGMYAMALYHYCREGENDAS
jgi:hypothetical protein